MSGWGVTVAALSGRAFELAPDAVRRAVLLGLCAWFVVDSAGSAASGNTSNVLFNVLVLALAAGPLWLAAGASRGRSLGGDGAARGAGA